MREISKSETEVTSPKNKFEVIVVSKRHEKDFVED